MIKELSQRAVILSLKQKKNPFQKAVLGKTEHIMRDITATEAHEEKVEFDSGSCTIRVECICEVVGVEPVEKVSVFDSALNVVSFGQLGEKKKEIYMKPKVEVHNVEKKVETSEVIESKKTEVPEFVEIKSPEEPEVIKEIITAEVYKVEITSHSEERSEKVNQFHEESPLNRTHDLSFMID